MFELENKSRKSYGDFMLKEKVDTIILDIDGTLSPEVSWLKLTECLGASKEEHSSIFERFKQNEIDYPTAKKMLIGIWQETGKANRSSLEEIFRSWKLKDRVGETIDYLKPSYNLCLISGSVDLYVKAVAAELGIENWYANTELIFDENDNLVDFNYYRDQAVKKLEHFNEYIKDNNLDKSRCLIIGNGDSDVSLFQELPYGIAVDTDLHADVEKYAYKVISDLKELLTIL